MTAAGPVLVNTVYPPEKNDLSSLIRICRLKPCARAERHKGTLHVLWCCVLLDARVLHAGLIPCLGCAIIVRTEIGRVAGFEEERQRRFDRGFVKETVAVWTGICGEEGRRGAGKAGLWILQHWEGDDG